MLYLRGRQEKKPKRITAFLFLTDTFRKAFDKDTVSVKEMYVFHSGKQKARFGRAFCWLKSKNSKAGWFFAAPLVDQFSKLGKAVSKFFREIEQHLSINEMNLLYDLFRLHQPAGQSPPNAQAAHEWQRDDAWFSLRLEVHYLQRRWSCSGFDENFFHRNSFKQTFPVAFETFLCLFNP